MEGLLLGRVVKVHQHDNSLDIQLSYDGSKITGVPLISPTMSSSSGRVDIHHPELSDWDTTGSSTRDVHVIVALFNGQYLAIGFLAQQVSQMMFDRQNFRIDRHASDVYSTIDKKGNIELAHPSGTFIRIATDPGHEDLTGKDFDNLWDVSRNKTEAVWLAVTVAKNGKPTTNLQIDPDGNVTLVNNGDLTINSKGGASINAKSVTVNANTKINGSLSINGSAVDHNGTNIGKKHAHKGVKSGPSVSSKPV